MMDLFAYEFMQRAFVVGTFLALILPCVGLTVLLKRLSMIGDTLSHSSLAGLTIGLVLGFNPLLAAMVACVVAGLGIEVIRNRLKAYQEVSTVIILAASIGLAGIFASWVENSNAISSYLFGSIIAISDQEYILVIVVSILVLLTYRLAYRAIYLSTFDPKAASMMGIQGRWINGLVTLLTAVVVSISAKTIGSLIVSSLLVIPSIMAMQVVKTYRATLALSMGLSLAFVYGGLVISYFFDLRPGSVIVLCSVLALSVTLVVKRK